MGLRERNAAQTRELILTSALDLFHERGYESTTMEEIAERADVGPSTLYRYFASKDRLVIEPIALRGQMATEFRHRPDDEPVATSLGHAVLAMLVTPRPDPLRFERLLAVLETVPSLQARLREEYAGERTRLEDALRERLGRPEGDVFCAMTARMTVQLLEVLGDQRFDGSDNAAAVRRAVDFLRQALETLSAEPPLLPELPDEVDLPDPSGSPAQVDADPIEG